MLESTICDNDKEEAISLVQVDNNVIPYTTVKKAYGYRNNLLAKLALQRETSPQMCDLVILAGDQRFPVHKCIMIASSDYIDAMLRSGMQETRSNQIELKSISPQDLKIVVDFIYTGELRLSIRNIAEMIKVVSHLQVKYALKLCEEFLIEETTVENCIEMLQLAEIFCIQKVRTAVNLYILKNFDKLIFNEKYKKLTLEQMSCFLSSNKLKLFPEIRVFSACVNYLQSYHEHHSSNTEAAPAQPLDQQRDTSLTYELMKHVRFNTMKAEDFIDIVTKNPLIKSDEKCQELLVEAYEYFALPNRQYCSASKRSAIRNEPAMVCVNESMYMLNKREDIWQYLCQSQATCKTLSQKFVVINNFLYACGGYSETSRETCNRCHRFDPRVGLWTSIAPMNEKRQFFTLASCSEFIVAVGGVFGNVGNFYATNPVAAPLEYYSIEKNSWTSLKKCKIPVLKWPGVCIFKQGSGTNKVFIVGGKLTGPSHNLSTDSFIIDLKTSEVELCAPPITTRFNPSVFYDASQQKIVLFAGEDEKYRLAPCIETFDLTTRQWTEIATIPVSLSYQCISSTSMVNSKIYYLLEEHDGPSSESYILKSAYFDLTTYQFDAPKQLPHPSTLASKWCTLVFPREFLEKYQSLSSADDGDLNMSFDDERTNPSIGRSPSNQSNDLNESDDTLYNSDIVSSSSLYDTSQMQPQLVIDNFKRANSRTNRTPSKIASNTPSRNLQKSRSHQMPVAHCSSHLDDDDPTRLDLLMLKSKGNECRLRALRRKGITAKRGKSNQTNRHSSYSPELDYLSGFSNISSSSTNSVHTSSEDLSDN